MAHRDGIRSPGSRWAMQPQRSQMSALLMRRPDGCRAGFGNTALNEGGASIEPWSFVVSRIVAFTVSPPSLPRSPGGPEPRDAIPPSSPQTAGLESAVCARVCAGWGRGRKMRLERSERPGLRPGRLPIGPSPVDSFAYRRRHPTAPHGRRHPGFFNSLDARGLFHVGPPRHRRPTEWPPGNLIAPTVGPLGPLLGRGGPA